MTYQKAIEDAKIAAKVTGCNQIVYEYLPNDYSRKSAHLFEAHLFVKLLTITPDGTITQ